jgi:hypothetical protein
MYNTAWEDDTRRHRPHRTQSGPRLRTDVPGHGIPPHGLGLSGAIGQVFIFVTIAKFGALTCAIIGLARKVSTLGSKKSAAHGAGYRQRWVAESFASSPRMIA